jgi:hypothetical protein
MREQPRGKVAASREVIGIRRQGFPAIVAYIAERHIRGQEQQGQSACHDIIAGAIDSFRSIRLDGTQLVLAKEGWEIQCAALSTGRCNAGLPCICRSVKSERLARTRVEAQSDLVEMRLGKYCRGNPLVFSFEPRCQGGLLGSQKYTWMSLRLLGGFTGMKKRERRSTKVVSGEPGVLHSRSASQ